MSSAAASQKVFPNYMEVPKVLPVWVWQVVRIAVLAATFYIIYLSITEPATALTLLWKIIIPSLPLIFATVPGLWRNICPMAFLNQLPRTLGFSIGASLPAWAKTTAFLIAVVLFFIFTLLRHPWLNHDGHAVAALIAGSLLLALGGGILFKGRSGWCGTFCPLAPIQKVYGQAPLSLIRNGYCESCVGCQKNCYDFNPRAAIYSDIYDQDTWYADHRKFFVAALPGLVVAFFTVQDPAQSGIFPYLQHMLLWPLVSIGVFQAVGAFTRLSPYKVAVTFSMAALAIFYWFAAPVMMSGVRDVFGWSISGPFVGLFRGAVMLVCLGVIAKGVLGEKLFLQSIGVGSNASISGGADELKKRLEKTGSIGDVTERTSGHHFTMHGEEPLLDALEEAGIPIEAGCRMGLCGADPVLVLQGEDNITPPSEDELATLKRLGLQGKCRLACQCRVSGSITIDVNVDQASRPASTEGVSDRRGKRIVIIGNGVAGITAAETLRANDPHCSIDIVARESHYFYNRMGLGRVVYGRSAMGGLYLLPDTWYSRNKINVWRNTVATKIDRADKIVALGTRENLPYDQLILATGAAAFSPPMPGRELAGSFVLREADDALRMRAWCQRNQSHTAVVLGGGVLGIEAADALRRLGLHTTIVHRACYLMDRQLDEHASEILRHFLESIGIAVHCGVGVGQILGESRVEKVLLSNGTVLSADLFLVCAGTRSNTDLAKDAGLEVNRGVLVNAQMQTSDPDIYAIGDVAEVPGSIGGLWPVAMDQAKIAATAITGEVAYYEPHLAPVHLKVRGIDVKSYGNITVDAKKEEISYLDSSGTKWRKIVVSGSMVTGAIFINEPRYARVVWESMQHKRSVDKILRELRAGDWETIDKIA